MRRFFSALVLAAVVTAAPSLARAEDEDVPTKLNSKPLFVGGMVMAGVGGTAMIVGGMTLLFDAMMPHPQPVFDTCEGCGFGSFQPQGPSPVVIGGGIALGAGAALVAASIPMMVIGIRRVPIRMSPSGPEGSTGMTLRLTF